MTFYADPSFFALLALAVAGAAFLGLREKPLARYGMAASVVFLACLFCKDLPGLIAAAGFVVVAVLSMRWVLASAAFQPALRRRVRAHAAAARVGEGGRGVRSEPAGLHGRVLPHVQGAAGDVRGARRRDQGMRAVRLPVLPAVLPRVHVGPHRPVAPLRRGRAGGALARRVRGPLGARHPARARRARVHLRRGRVAAPLLRPRNVGLGAVF